MFRLICVDPFISSEMLFCFLLFRSNRVFASKVMVFSLRSLTPEHAILPCRRPPLRLSENIPWKIIAIPSMAQITKHKKKSQQKKKENRTENKKCYRIFAVICWARDRGKKVQRLFDMMSIEVEYVCIGSICNSVWKLKLVFFKFFFFRISASLFIGPVALDWWFAWSKWKK